jgi:hypothetical protein
MKLQVHGSYVGKTGYNNHTRDFLRQLQKYCDIRVRNFSVGDSWNGMSNTPHDGESYITDDDRKMLYQQTLWTQKPNRADFKMYESEDKEFQHDIDMVLSRCKLALHYLRLVFPFQHRLHHLLVEFLYQYRY